jgi:hypothetical protein
LVERVTVVILLVSQGPRFKSGRGDIFYQFFLINLPFFEKL